MSVRCHLSRPALRGGSALVPALLLAAAALAVPLRLPAQRVDVGPVFGLALATTYTTYSADCPQEPGGPPNICVSASSPDKPRIGVIVGGFARAQAGRHLSARAELTYTQKGYAGTHPSLREDYIELPVLLRLDSGGRSAGLFLTAGAGVGLLLDCSLEDQGGCDYYYMHRPHLFDPEWLAGVGVRAGAVALEGRFARSLASTGLEGSAHTVNETLYLALSFHPARRSDR